MTLHAMPPTLARPRRTPLRDAPLRALLRMMACAARLALAGDSSAVAKIGPRPAHWGRGVALVLALVVLAVGVLPLPGFGFDALAHGMAGKDAEFVKHSVGAQILPFFYLGAKHMATGYDH